ncbi:hypothetical protein [Maribellus sediminis]|uniref:hypothetical protein n=1 Tax=Maribellus sediminis TaxID=2696285 RepID=UPI0014315C57|nr:hypothetical protein [Maribellus sediminis]
MEKFDSNSFHSSILAEFKKLDDIMEAFQNEFKTEILDIINNSFKQANFSEELKEMVLTYANQMFNTAESVSDKDKNYNEFRLADEVNIMTKVVTELSEQNKESKELADKIHQKAKELMVNYNPFIMDLSANGFRLLEKYTLMYNNFFIGSFTAHIQNA